MTFPARPQLSQHTLDAIAELDATDPHRHQHAPTAPEPVEYGTDTWRELHDDDPRKLAAVFAAADAWNQLLDSPYAAEVLTAYYEWDDRRIHSEWTDAASHITRDMGTPGPTYAELEALRAEPGRIAESWRERHGSEHTGGPVAWLPATQAAAA
jgi:hypothetical protein